MSRPEQMMLAAPAQHHHHAAAAAAACNMSFATGYFVDVFTASFSNGLNSVVESIRIWFYYWFVARLNFQHSEASRTGYQHITPTLGATPSLYLP
jgi:hypothetical protein